MLDRAIADPNPEGVLWTTPFIKDSGDKLEVEYPDGSKVRVADITTRGSYQPGGETSARFSRGISSADLVDAGIGLPPFHFGCRSTTAPV